MGVHEKLQDLRLLYLAAQVEEVFEKLERAFEGHLDAGPVRQAIRPLFTGGPAHARLQAELKALNEEVQIRQHELSEADILQALLDCERLAQGFYQLHLDDLSSSRLAHLFRELADEEGLHIRAVEKAMALLPGGR